MILNLERDIVEEINANNPVFAYDLPYVLTTEKLENICFLIENAPEAYSIEIMPSQSYPDEGLFILIELIEDNE